MSRKRDSDQPRITNHEPRKCAILPAFFSRVPKVKSGEIKRLVAKSENAAKLDGTEVRA